jgi:hypothetical protein
MGHRLKYWFIQTARFPTTRGRVVGARKCTWIPGRRGLAEDQLLESLHVITHRATLNVSRELAQFVARAVTCAPARTRHPHQHPGADLLLASGAGAALDLRRRRYGRARARPGVSRSTAYRYIDVVIDVLACLVPGLREVLELSEADGLAYVILDGRSSQLTAAVSRSPASRATRPTCGTPGRRHEHGGLIQALARRDGFPLWVSEAVPESTHDLWHLLGIVFVCVHEGALIERQAAIGHPVSLHHPIEGPGSTAEDEYAGGCAGYYRLHLSNVT